MKWLIVFCLIITSVINISMLENVKPSFRILAPQVICKGMKNETLENPSQITISMQTKNGQKLNYKIEIYFELLGGFRNQQHTLRLWSAVRRLQTKINKKEREIVSIKNQINVNNTELIPGVFYTFKIIGYNGDGIESEPQNFTVNFSDGKIKRTNPDGTIIPDDVSFLLIGAEQMYADIDYIAVTEVSFCDHRNDYYIKWNMSNLPEKYENYLNVPGKVLNLPSGILKGGEVYQLTASLFQSNESTALIRSALKFTVKKRGYSTFVVPENILIGISQPFELKLILNNPDNIEDLPEISWNCVSLSMENNCDSFKSSDNTSQWVEFYKKGTVNVTAAIKLNEEIILAEAIINIDQDVIALPVIHHVPSEAIPSGSDLDIEVTIHNLIPNCFAEWTVVKEDGFAYFDSSILPRGLGNITILDIEENFLNELVDYVNNTLSRDIKLTIPATNLAIGWPGLEPNAKYKFRLNITCPVPIVNDDVKDRPNITSFMDITINTNQPPIGQPLEIQPANGTGLATVFKFSTGVAKDIETDYPLKYTFKYQIEDSMVKIAEYYENMVATSMIPYSDSPIATLVEICDSRQACSIEYGPKIKTAPPTLTMINLAILIENFNSSMGRFEYDEAFGNAMSLLITLKNLNDSKNSELIENTITQIIQNEIQKLKSNSTSYYISSAKIINFVQLAKQTITIIGNHENVIRDLLEFLQSESLTLDERSNPIISNLRSKRSIGNKLKAKRDTQGDVMKLSLEMAGALLNSTNEIMVYEEKQRLLQVVDKYVEKICRNAKVTSKIFVVVVVVSNMPIVSMEIRKINLNQLLRSDIIIPTDASARKAYVSLSENIPIPDSKRTFCVGKIRYPSDYLTGQIKSNEIYELYLMDIDANGNVSKINISDTTNGQSIGIKVPIDNVDQNKKCQIWNDGTWSSAICVTLYEKNNFLYCRCNSIGYFRASNEQFETSTPQPAQTQLVTQSVSTLARSSENMAFVSTTLAPSTVAATTSVPITLAFTTLTPTTLAPTPLASTIPMPPPPTTITPATMNPTTSPTILAPTSSAILAPTSIAPTTSLATMTPTTIPATMPPTTIASATFASTIANLIEPKTTLSEPTQQSNFEHEIVKVTTDQLSAYSIATSINKPSSSNSSALMDTSNLQTSSATYAAAYTLASLLLLATIIFLVVFIVHRRRKISNGLNRQFDIIAAELRQPTSGIKYGLFHEEDNMRGDNVETIFAIR